MVEAIDEVKRIAPLVPGDHVAHDVLGEVHGGAHVEIDEPQLVLEVGIGGERAAGSDPGVQRDGVDWAAGGRDLAVERIDTLVGGEVDLQVVDLPAQGAQLCGGGGDGVVRRGPQAPPDGPRVELPAAPRFACIAAQRSG